MNPETERPILITADLLDDRVDFERGMSPFPPLTLGIGALLAVLFVRQVARGSLDAPEALMAAGAMEASAVRGGEIWRLWSASLLHGGWDHLAGNLTALFILGMACEHAFGRLQFAFLYVASALAGSVASVLWIADGIPALGASGAIFGLMGATVVVIRRNRARLYVRDKRVGIVVAAWAAWSILLGSLDPNIDNWGHAGGFAGGAAAAWFLRPRVLDPRAPFPAADWVLFSAGAAAAAGLTIPWMLS